MDDRTPPPGIEVIGELPPGVPWWDAEKLGLRANRKNILSAGYLVVWILLFTSFRGMMNWPGYVDNTPLQIVSWVVAGSAILVAVFFGTQIFRRIPVAIVRNVIGRRKWSIGTSAFPSSIEVTSILLVELVGEIPVDGNVENANVSGVALSLSDDPFVPVARVHTDRFLVNPIVLYKLLTYRIAKAKGENPPPPAFS